MQVSVNFMAVVKKVNCCQPPKHTLAARMDIFTKSHLTEEAHPPQGLTGGLKGNKTE
jgi:hypothetical protein